jgi:cyanophycin synthetase
LLDRLPGLRDHHCASGAPGGFVERLHGGTYFGHIVEHTAIELASIVGVGANYGKTLYARAPGRYDMILAYKNEAASRYLLQVALELVEALIDTRPYALDEKLAAARRIVSATELGPSTRAIVDAAEARNIPWVRLSEGSLVQLGQGIHRRLIQATESSLTGDIAVDIACDKALTKELLEQASIPVPRGIIARTKDEARTALDELRPPLAVKPLDGNQGRAVSLRLTTPQQVSDAYELAAQVSPDVVIEEFLEGKDYRVMVVGGKMLAASERLPAHVIGDGAHTIAQLIDLENRSPLRGEGHEKPLTRLTVDAGVLAYLERAGRTLTDVPAAGERIFLRQTANLSTGGTARDVTDEVHPDVARLCERAARIVGLDICGVDLITPDIGQPLPETGAGIVELNASPGIRMHHYPTEGRPRDVGRGIVDMLYPSGMSARIPIVAITGTNGKTTVTRLIGHILEQTGKVVGMTTTDGIYVGGHQVAQGDLTGFNSCRTVLADPLVEMAVLETARGGIVRRSLGYDWSDVAVLTNVQPDHLGQDGIETIDDLLFVKSLVAERVREGGVLVLNADDERLARLPEIPRVRKLPRQIIFFALSGENPVLREHRAGGGTAYFLRDGWLIEATGADEHRIAREQAIPLTLGGAAKFQTANALAASAACRALGIARHQVAVALEGFDSGRHNHGRMNVYQTDRGYVVVDYGHNPGAFTALAGLTDAWSARRVTGIFTVPGDRTDDLIDEVGRLAARCFDRLFIREDEDLRGRQPGEISRLLCLAAQDEAPDKECRIIPDETEALAVALEEMEEGEVIVFLYEKHTEPSLEILRRFGARPASSVEPRAHMLQPA